RVTWRACWSRLAPSISAASYRCCGISCKPAKKMIVVGPIPQRLIKIKAGFDQTSLLNHGGPGMPTRASRSLINPYSGCKIQAQTTDAATTGTIEGRKKVARKKDCPGVL